MLFRNIVSAMLPPVRLLPPMLLSAALLGCSPVLDWREFEPEGSGVIVTFPCRPDRHARDVTVAGVTTRMTMLVCAAADVTYALTFIDVAEPAGVTAALADLRAVAAGNLAATRAEPNPLQVTGMTPNPQSTRLHLSGSRTDGAAVQQQAAFFAKGLRVYQASAVGAALSAEAVDTFFAGLKLAS
jgi:hypothetical protein